MRPLDIAARLISKAQREPLQNGAGFRPWLLPRRPEWTAWVSARAAWGLGLIVLAAALLSWRAVGRRGDASFPRDPSHFLPAAELDRRLEAVSQRLKADPGDVRALLESGLLHFQKGREFYPDAINELEESWRSGLLDARVFYYLGAMYQDEGLFSFAMAHYQRFLRNRPDDSEAHLLLAKLLYQSGQYEEALAHYDRYRKRSSWDPVIEENIGLCLSALKRPDEAAKVFQELASGKSPEARRANFYLGQTAFDAQQYREALNLFARALPVDDALALPPATVHAALAANFEKLELWLPAQRQWEQVLLSDPKNAHAKSHLRTAKAAIRKAEQAARAAARRKKK